MRALFALSAALLAGCGPEPSNAPETPAKVPAGAEAPLPAQAAGRPDPPAPPPPVQSLPGLLPLTGEQVQAELGAGPFCTLSDGGRLLMAAKVGGAIANDRGSIVHLTPAARDWNALGEGGRFAAAELAVEVDAGAVVGHYEELVERDASVTVARGGRAFAVSHGPLWACRS